MDSTWDSNDVIEYFISIWPLYNFSNHLFQNAKPLSNPTTDQVATKFSHKKWRKQYGSTTNRFTKQMIFNSHRYASNSFRCCSSDRKVMEGVNSACRLVEDENLNQRCNLYQVETHFFHGDFLVKTFTWWLLIRGKAMRDKGVPGNLFCVDQFKLICLWLIWEKYRALEPILFTKPVSSSLVAWKGELPYFRWCNFYVYKI